MRKDNTAKAGTPGVVGHIGGEPTCSSTNYFEVETAPVNSESNVGNSAVEAYEGPHGEIDPKPIVETFPD